jgi:hypothetical protein
MVAINTPNEFENRRMENSNRLPLHSIEGWISMAGGTHALPAGCFPSDLATPADEPGRGLFGSDCWPRRLFSFDNILLEQQVFISEQADVAALSWKLLGRTATPVKLVVRPLFFHESFDRRRGGFCLEPGENGGRLVWQPSADAPRIVADMNGAYRDDRFQLLNPCAALNACHFGVGLFEFELKSRPAVLILGLEKKAAHRAAHEHVGRFLADLAPERQRAAWLTAA